MKRKHVFDESEFICCECGFKIMLVNDVDKMGLLIENHALEHKCKEVNVSKAEQTFDRIQDLLINKVFEKACKE